MEGLNKKNSNLKTESVQHHEQTKYPPINYINISIDDDYIEKNLLPNGGLQMKGGHANWNNQVDIMRYSISPNLSPKYHAFVQDKIEKMLSNQEKTYQHESHHIRNRENNLTPHKVAENLREFLTFRLLDELSAFMVGELYNKELTIENILESLQTARKKIIDSYYDQPFISEAHWYVSQHTGNQNLYSRTIGTEKYHSIIRQYFTTNKGNIISLLQESGKMSEFTAITNDLITRLDPLLKIKK
jgi:hypothetical protein